MIAALLHGVTIQQIHRAAREQLQGFGQAQVTLQERSSSIRLEGDEEVGVAARLFEVAAARRGPEHLEAAHREAPASLCDLKTPIFDVLMHEIENLRRSGSGRYIGKRGREKRRAGKKLIQSMGAFESLGAYLEHVALVLDLDRGEGEDAVQIMTRSGSTMSWATEVELD